MKELQVESLGIAGLTPDEMKTLIDNPLWVNVYGGSATASGSRIAAFATDEDGAKHLTRGDLEGRYGEGDVTFACRVVPYHVDALRPTAVLLAQLEEIFDPRDTTYALHALHYVGRMAAMRAIYKRLNSPATTVKGE